MGANSTQALGILCTLVAFVLLAGAFAGGGFMAVIGFLVLQAAAIVLFVKCKPWENRAEEPSSGSIGRVSTGGVKG
jgi:hypothetical protein